MREIKQPIRKRPWNSELFQDANRVISTHLEQPQYGFSKKLKILEFFEPKHKNFHCLLKIEGSIKIFFKYQATPVFTKPFKTIPLSGDSNLVTQSL